MLSIGVRHGAGLSHMDFGELGQDVDEEVVVPASPFQFAPHRPFAGIRPRRVQRRLAQQGRVLRAMTLPVSRLVFVAGYVQYPMQPVLNPPMAPHDAVAALRRPRPPRCRNPAPSPKATPARTASTTSRSPAAPAAAVPSPADAAQLTRATSQICRGAQPCAPLLVFLVFAWPCGPIVQPRLRRL